MADLLLMDDDRDLVSVLEEALTFSGHDVTTASSASEALEIINVREFDLLITDIIVFKDEKSVPDGGISLISKLRGPMSWSIAPWAKTMPIIAISGALSGQGTSDVLKTARMLGADLALGKPADLVELLQAIEQLTKDQSLRPANKTHN